MPSNVGHTTTTFREFKDRHMPEHSPCERHTGCSSIKIMDGRPTNEHVEERSNASARVKSAVRAPAESIRAASVGAAAIGALAIGAAAIGALAIGRVLVGTLRLKRGHVRALTVENLIVGRLHIRELVIDREDR
jgi:hypothetical protein